MTPHQINAVQRYSVGYRCDDWGMRSSTPTCIPAPNGEWVSFSDVQALQAGYDAARLEIEHLQARLEACQKSGQDWAMRVHAQEQPTTDDSSLVQAAKPVAWIYTSKLAGNQTYITRFASDLTTYKADKVQPLYTAPQPSRQPLTEDEIYECERVATIRHQQHKHSIRGQQITPADLLQWHFARAIERAHGIGGES